MEGVACQRISLPLASQPLVRKGLPNLLQPLLYAREAKSDGVSVLYKVPGPGSSLPIKVLPADTFIAIVIKDKL